ncbi:MAG: hypothetical protein K8R92_00315 [Planctomycetes bacterium]|nr:hypothetical protein [Planctomycetota bacterium]
MNTSRIRNSVDSSLFWGVAAFIWLAVFVLIASAVNAQDSLAPNEEIVATTKPKPDDGEPGKTQPPATNAGPFALQLNLDFTNAYFYHGILQQNQGLIVQPALKLNVTVFKQDDLQIDGILATWNSFGQNAGTQTSALQKYWYECDLIGGFVLTKGKFSFTTTYTFLTAPSNAYQTVQELDFIFAYDDSDLLGKFALHPYALVGIETGANASNGTQPGSYLEMGIAPGFTLDLDKTPVTLSFPQTVGLSLHDYYQNAAGSNNTFGFFQTGVKASLPLPFGDRYGKWTLNAAVSEMFLGTNTTAFNRGHDTQFIATLGVQVNF